MTLELFNAGKELRAPSFLSRCQRRFGSRMVDLGSLIFGTPKLRLWFLSNQPKLGTLRASFLNHGRPGFCSRAISPKVCPAARLLTLSSMSGNPNQCGNHVNSKGHQANSNEGTPGPDLPKMEGGGLKIVINPADQNQVSEFPSSGKYLGSDGRARRATWAPDTHPMEYHIQAGRVGDVEVPGNHESSRRQMGMCHKKWLSFGSP